MTSVSNPLLKVRGLVKEYGVPGATWRGKQLATFRAVDQIDLDVTLGETHGLVGESGCGKSTVARTILRLQKPTAGSAHFEGDDIFTMSGKQLRAARQEMQIIFQDPFASLNPRMTVQSIVEEPLVIHKQGSKHDRTNEVKDLLQQVGLNPEHAGRYPHQFSGGQRQRIGIARALALNPKLIIADEPVSALDVSIQAQIVNLLRDLQQDLGLSYLFIAHDLAVVRHISDTVSVMYLGKIVETGTREQIYTQAAHPYTQALLSAVPEPDPLVEASRQRIVLSGDVPSPSEPPSGCKFRTRCWKAQDICSTTEPVLEDRGQDHPVACHFADVEISLPDPAKRS